MQMWEVRWIWPLRDNLRKAQLGLQFQASSPNPSRIPCKLAMGRCRTNSCTTAEKSVSLYNKGACMYRLYILYSYCVVYEMQLRVTRFGFRFPLSTAHLTSTQR